MDYAQLKAESIVDEGLKLKPYYCSKNKLSIGIGRNLTANGLSATERATIGFLGSDYKKLVLNKAQVDMLFRNDVNNSVSDLRKVFKDFDTYTDELQHVLINLMFQLGYKSFTGFKETIKHIKAKKWMEAAAELRDSELYREDTPNDAERLAKRLEAMAA